MANRTSNRAIRRILVSTHRSYRISNRRKAFRLFAPPGVEICMSRVKPSAAQNRANKRRLIKPASELWGDE